MSILPESDRDLDLDRVVTSERIVRGPGPRHCEQRAAATGSASHVLCATQRWRGEAVESRETRGFVCPCTDPRDCWNGLDVGVSELDL